MSDEPLLSLNRVSVGHGAKVVLADLGFSLRRGSFTALLGANGSGKTTLLKTVAGILPPLAGEIAYVQIGGRLPALGYVPQQESLDSLFPLSTFDVVVMGAYGRIGPGRFVSRDERQFVRECVNSTGMEEFIGLRFSELSGGQKQRALIARALMTRPELLLLDEPTTGIDASNAKTVMDLLAELHRTRRITILMVTHDVGMARRHAEDVIWLRRGEVLQGRVSTLLTAEKAAELLEVG